jgi:hypothetical protein
MSLVNFTNLDFDQIKSSIRDYLRSNSNFTDYDFEGSNLSIIIDTLAYNTYIASYNANMVSNEVFIDSATLRENIVSLARNIGYVPKSVRSSKANISFSVDIASNASFVTLKAGTVCRSVSFGNLVFVFSILNDITVPVVNGTAVFDSIEILEGSLFKTAFTVDSTNVAQRFILENRGIDTTTLLVSVRDTEASSSSRKYTNSSSILDVTSSSKVYFLQEIEDERYELIFGDGVFGTKLVDRNYIEVSYLISSGESSNGVSNFTFTGRLVDSNGNNVTENISLVTTNVGSSLGSNIESVNSIRNFAPRLYAAQNRAVTASDYETIVARIYPEADSVSAFGGEDLQPPQFGKVFISIKPRFGSFISNNVKDNIKRELKNFSVAGISPEILDIKFLYIEIETNAYYNTNTTLSSEALKTKILDNINKYSKSEELNKYGARFKYSRYQSIVDKTDSSITSNITRVQMRRDLKVSQNKFAQYEICFRNAFYVKRLSGFNIKSSGFKVSGISNTVYFGDTPNPGGKTGNIFLFYLDSTGNPISIKKSVGTIDYSIGEIRTTPLNIISTSKNDGGTPIIEISAIPESNDILGIQDIYLQIDSDENKGNVKVNVIPDNIESGSDTSGSNYLVTSSYSNGKLVRN